MNEVIVRMDFLENAFYTCSNIFSVCIYVTAILLESVFVIVTFPIYIIFYLIYKLIIGGVYKNGREN